MNEEKLVLRVHGDASLPTLIYLPGLHGDWTLITAFRAALEGQVRLVEMTYPRSLVWKVEDYADAIIADLKILNISRAWLLGESFGSQVAWALAGKSDKSNDSTKFHAEGLILAGGFVKHPWPWGPGALRKIGGTKSMSFMRLLLKLYGKYSKFRQRRVDGAQQSLEEFRARRNKLDGQAISHRLALLDDYDPRPIARATTIPVYYLAGLIDPLVPWLLVRRWLRKYCPGYVRGKTFWLADHAVLATSPKQSADLFVHWIANHQKT